MIALFGCGGNRDKIKRSKMGSISEKYCDRIFVTSDNPRNESLDEIISHIIQGFNNKKHEVIKNRQEAIQCAIKSMKRKSILFVLGKGRENYQIINGNKIFFSDIDTVKNNTYAN